MVYRDQYLALSVLIAIGILLLSDPNKGNLIQEIDLTGDGEAGVKQRSVRQPRETTKTSRVEGQRRYLVYSGVKFFCKKLETHWTCPEELEP